MEKTSESEHDVGFMSEQNIYFQEEEKELKHLDAVKCLKPKQK